VGKKRITKTGRIRRPLPPPRPETEATNERLARAGGEHVALVSSIIEKAGEKTVLCRKFADSYVDRLRRNGRLTYAQWYAAEWYRERYEQSGLGGRVVANYDMSGAGGGGECAYGMPTSERQARARQAWRKAREFISPQLLGLVDAVVLHDTPPPFRNGQQRARHAARMASALQPLADWLQPADAA
jgi:hypothetical protein